MNWVKYIHRHSDARGSNNSSAKLLFIREKKTCCRSSFQYISFIELSKVVDIIWGLLVNIVIQPVRK